MRRYSYSSEYDEQSLMNYKWANLIFSLFLFVTGLVTFGVCIWIRFDIDFREWVREIDWYVLWNCMYVIMITMVILILTSALGTYGTLYESRGVLAVTIFFYVVIWIMEFVGTCLILINGVEESKTLTNRLMDVFWALIYRYDVDPRASRIMKKIQEMVGCCGANGSEDYIAVMKPVPFECRDPIRGVEYGSGCTQAFAWWLEPWTATLGGICVVLMLTHMIHFILIAKLMQKIKKYEKAPSHEY